MGTLDSYEGAGKEGFVFNSTLWAVFYIGNLGVDSTFLYSTAIYKDYGFLWIQRNWVLLSSQKECALLNFEIKDFL